MAVERILPHHAPTPRGPYTPAVRAGDFIFVSGQGPVDPVTDKLSPGDIGHQTRVTLKYRSQIGNHLVPAFGELRLCDVDRPGVEAWLAAKEADGLGWWSRVDLKGILSAVFTAAKDWRLWDGDNPTRGVRIGKKRLVREKRLLGAEDLRRLLGALGDRARFIVSIAFGGALRISEILGLRWSDVDFDARTLVVHRRWYRGDLGEEHEMKSKASDATVRLCDPFLAEFRQRYPGPHRREEFRPVLKRLGLYYQGFGWHAFRRENITWRQQVGGATPLEAQRAARHASLDMTYLYTLSDFERETAQQQRCLTTCWGCLMGA